MFTQDGWFTEFSFHKSVGQSYKVKKVLHEEQSKYQKIEVLETVPLGRLLLLNGKTMVSDLDEFVYHETMAHISWMVSPNTENVLIIGGGDGGLVREFAKHPDIKRIDLVEIDERVIEVSKKFFPDCTSALGDKRVRVLAMDGNEFIKSHEGEYDIIIIDSTDPEDFAAELFTSRFYSLVKKALRPDGIVMAQTENPFFDEFGVGKIYDNLRNVFPVVESLYAPMIIYPGVFWTFAFASLSKKGTTLNASKKPAMEKLQKTLKWYNMDWHIGAFSISNFQKRKLGINP
jgi:spermidine synthase